MGDPCETNVCKSAGTPTSDCFGFVTSARSLSARKEIWRLSSANESSTSRRLVTALPSPARYHQMHHHLSSLSHHAAPWLSKTTSAAHLKTMVDFRPGFWRESGNISVAQDFLKSGVCFHLTDMLINPLTSSSLFFFLFSPRIPQTQRVHFSCLTCMIISFKMHGYTRDLYSRTAACCKKKKAKKRFLRSRNKRELLISCKAATCKRRYDS